MPRPERIGREAAALVLGIKERTVIHLAATGQLPGAAKIGRTWTFDETRLRAYVRGQEDQICQRSEKPQRAAIGAARRFGAASSSKVSRSDGPSILAMSELRQRVARSYEKTKSQQGSSATSE